MKVHQSPLVKFARGVGLVIGLGIFIFLAVVNPSQAKVSSADTQSNAITNPGFENGIGSWICRKCNLTSGQPAHSGSAAGQMKTTSNTARGMLFQKNISLQPKTTYELTFWAKSSGKDLTVDLQKQSSPFTNYGLKKTVDVTSEWKQFSITFTTTGFGNPVSNARLRFRAPKGKNLTFSIDDISLVALDGPPPTDPTSTPPPTNPTATPPPTAPTATPTSVPPTSGSEMLVFDWNGRVTEAEHGFPWDKPPMENGNWKSPINYAEGTFYLRAEVKSIPKSQPGMKVQFCIWQDRSVLENCTKTVSNNVGVPGNVVTWQVGVQNLWKKNSTIIDWSRARDRNGFAIKNGNGKPVSDYSGWNWNGENPDNWYPMTVRFTVVVVAKGSQFSGWGNYIP
ncbi:MAG: carbohydrate binding domain-containing protein [Chloroflexota bacterium]